MSRVVLVGDDIAALSAACEAFGVTTVEAFRAIAVQMDSTRLAAEELTVALAKFGSVQIATEPRSKPAYGTARPYLKKKKGRS